jgi:hypothetical protein
MNKGRSMVVRIVHVLFYSLILFLGFKQLGLTSSINVIYLVLAIAIPHLIIDSYKPIYYWAKYVQEDPNCQTLEQFKISFSNPRQLLMYVVIDQCFHFFSLMAVVAWCLGAF